MANEQNIKPHRFTSDQSREEAAKNGAKGGRMSGVARRTRRDFQELVRWALSLPLESGEVEEVLSFADSEGKNVTVDEAIVLAAARKAMNGDIAAITFLRDTAGEKPKERLEISNDISEAASEIQAMIEAAKSQDAAS